VIAAGVVLLLDVATSPVQVVHDRCPSGPEVELALASLLTSPSATAAARDVATLERRSEALHVELVDTDGVVIAERSLDGGASCAELARMAAIVIASWESDVHPEFARQPGEIVARPERPAPPAPAPPAVVPAPPLSYDVAAGVALGEADTLAAGASIGAAWFPRGIGFGLWTLAAVDRDRTIAVGTHEARWRRWTAGLELARRWARAGLALDAHAGATLGWIATEGVDYTQNRSASAVSLGGTAGIRAAWWLSRHAAFWIDLRGFYFPRQDAIYGTSGGATADQAPIPGAGGIASLGVALGRAPNSR
jgi:hypothetical protein